jgi:hypothetical protein
MNGVVIGATVICMATYLMADAFLATLTRVNERVDILDELGRPTGEVA